MVFVPDNQPQADAYYSEADEIYFGGRAGAGKSYLAIGLACTKHRNSTLFRKEFAQHKNPEGMMTKTMQLVGDGGKNLNKTDGVYSNIFGGRTIKFAGLRDDKDVSKRMGTPSDLYVFDEAPEMAENHVLTVIAWLRSIKKGQRLRVVLTGNPPTTPEGEWIVRRYAAWLDPDHPNPAKSGELRWYANVDGKEVERPNGNNFRNGDEWVYPRSRTFIPGVMVSYLKDAGYEKILQNLPEALKRKLLHGDFGVKPEDDLWQVIPTSWVQAAMDRWEDIKPEVPMTALGADIARGGRDKTVVACRYGNWFDKLVKVDGSETDDGMKAFQVIKGAQKNNCLMAFDPIGVGAAVYDIMKENREKYEPVNFAEGSDEFDKSGQYKLRNKRAECYWKFREALDPDNGENIALPPDRELYVDLRTPHYKITSQGITIESKEDIKKRINRSPDCADAVVMAYSGVTRIAYAAAEEPEQASLRVATPQYVDEHEFKSRLW